MPESYVPDPRDQVMFAAKALRGLHAILQDRAAPCYGDAELPYLVEMIADKLDPAAEALQGFVPRDFNPPAP